MSDLQKLQDDLTEVLGTKDTAFVMGIIEGRFNEDRKSPLGLLSNYMKAPVRTTMVPPVWYYDEINPQEVMDRLNRSLDSIGFTRELEAVNLDQWCIPKDLDVNSVFARLPDSVNLDQWGVKGIQSPKTLFERLLAQPPYPHFQAFEDSKAHFKMTAYMPDLLEYKPQGRLSFSHHSLAKVNGHVVSYVKNRKDII